MYIGSNGTFFYWDGSTFTEHTADITNDAGTIDRPINDILLYKGDLVICGQFGTVDGVTAKGVARYKNGVWEQVGQGLNQTDIINRCRTLFVKDEVLFCGGLFTSDGDGDTDIKGLAFFNESTDKWEELSHNSTISGNPQVFDLGVYSKKLTGGQ